MMVDPLLESLWTVEQLAHRSLRQTSCRNISYFMLSFTKDYLLPLWSQQGSLKESYSLEHKLATIELKREFSYSNSNLVLVFVNFFFLFEVLLRHDLMLFMPNICLSTDLDYQPFPSP